MGRARDLRGPMGSRDGMLSTPHKRFTWAKSERLSDFSFFRTLIKRRRRPQARVVALKERASTGQWKPAPWTPWLWMK
jgi:hypothetical protein